MRGSVGRELGPSTSVQGIQPSPVSVGPSVGASLPAAFSIGVSLVLNLTTLRRVIYRCALSDTVLTPK
jgi:hypothetical protein